MHEIIDKKFYLGPKFGTLINKKWITISELLQSCSHSTYPVTLCIYNLSPWLCMNRKFIIMPVLIQGPKQPDNDIDVYLRPLVDELLQLWAKPGVHAWDEHKQEPFDL
jgi:hypothetical protein